MASTYTLNNGIELIGTGEQSGTWGDTTNTNLELIDTALDGQISLTLSSAGSSGSPNALPVSDGASSNGRNRLISYVDGGDLGATAYVQLTPNDAEKIIYIRNALSGSRSIIVFQGTYNASNDYEIPAGTTAVVYFNGGGTGAVAANVFNNAYFDGLRLGSVSVTAILDEDNMASNSATALSTQQSIKAYVDSQVGTVDTLAEILANGNTTGGTDLAVSTGDDITFADNSKAIFGAGSDLEIYHDGTNNRLTLNSANTYIQTDGIVHFTDIGNNEKHLTINDDGAVQLYHDNASKLATTSTGIDVTGTAVTDGLTVAGNVSVDGGTIKLDGNYPNGVNNVALGNTALDTASGLNGYSVAIGTNALTAMTSGGSNVGVGYASGAAITTGGNNVAVGTEALDATTTGGSNVAIGSGALGANTTASNNTAVGYQAGYNNNTGQFNTSTGRQSLRSNTTGGENTALGDIAMYANTTGGYNVAVGRSALENNTTASENIAVGYKALYANTTGDGNTAIGVKAMDANTVGDRNVAVGADALGAMNPSSNTDMYNTAVGYHAGLAVTTGISNTLIGGLAGDSLTDADYNVAIGREALTSDTLGSRSVAIGQHALQVQNFTSATNTYNVAIGYDAGVSVTTGVNNTLIGGLAGDAITTGSQNTAVGQGSLSANTTASNNTAVGYEAGYSNTTGGQNTLVGWKTGHSLTTGVSNTFVGCPGPGDNCGSLITSGSKNTILGAYTGNQGGLDIRTSSNNIVLSDGDGRPLGYRSGSDGTWYFDNASGSQSAITARNTGTGGFPYGININYPNAAPNNDSGRFLTCSDSSAIRLKIFNNGNVVNQNNSYGADSDIKLKENITDASSQWDDIKALTVRKYSMKADELDAPNMLGVIAQEVEAAGMNGLVKEIADIDKDMNDLGTTTKSVNYSILYMKAVKALQEAMTRIETLETKVTALEG